MLDQDSEYWESSYKRIKEEIKTERRTIESNIPTLQEAVEALQHHQEQLIRLGATLEDNVCSILRKVIEQAKAKEQVAKLESDLNECKYKIDVSKWEEL